MNRNCLLFSAFAVLCASGLSAAADKIIRVDGPSPAELVNAALRGELEGSSELRSQLLAEALKRDPEYAPARWQSGYVKYNGEWMKVDDVPRHARANESLNEYRRRRDKMVDTADNHREMARWCHKRKLLNEERVHWAKVLEFERNDAEAIAELGLQLFDGILMTKEQVDAEKKNTAAALRSFHEWQPKIMRWRKAIEQGNAKQLDEALRGLHDINDPGAIGALEVSLSVPSVTKRGVELNLLLAETLGRFPQQEATDALLRRAVLAETEQLASAAVEQLKKRPMHTYVPKLIAAIPGKVKTRFNVFVLPSGMVLHEHEYYLEGLNADFSVSLHRSTSPADAAAAMVATPRALIREVSSALAAEAAADVQRTINAETSKKIRWVLERATGFANADDPALWKAQYDNYYTGDHSTPVKSVYQQSYGDGEASYSLPTHVDTSTVRSYHSCFPAGTKVCAITGDVPIETIRLGDLVLSQDLETGAVVYSPVQSTTLRQRTPMIKISMGSDELLATPAHPFWVVGEGWKPAKNLKQGDFLHTLNGAVEIHGLERVSSTEAYNLVVSENHDYFVGASRVLVHDNSPLASPPVSLPGLMASPENAQASRN
jgi:hypothetical protein